MTVGTGAQRLRARRSQVLYVGNIGQISSSTVFDSSAAHGNQPLSFTLGSNSLIAGFQIGVNGMKVGGERLLAIPPALGYGATGCERFDERQSHHSGQFDPHFRRQIGECDARYSHPGSYYEQ